jgi:hypothetical protein
MSISFEGGPLDGDELHGLTASVVANVDAAFVCFNIDGRWEHYVQVADGRCEHRGACHRLAEEELHADCGHDHTSSW